MRIEEIVLLLLVKKFHLFYVYQLPESEEAKESRK